MANRPSRLVVSAFAPSYDGRYHLSYPHGDKPVTGAELATHAASLAAASGALTAQVRLGGGAIGLVDTAAGLSTALRLRADARDTASASGSLPAGGGGETVGSYAAMNLAIAEIYRLSMISGQYPVFINGGSTHVNEPNGSWDGGPCARFTGPSTGDGQAGVGGLILDNGGALVIRKLNLRWEMLFGPTYQTNWPNNDIKYVIVHSADTPGGATNERPMMNWAHQSSQATGRLALAVASGTHKQFNPSYPPNQYGPDGGEQFYIGPTAGSFSGKPIIGANTWLSVEMECISEAQSGAPNGRIRGRVTTRAGVVLTDIIIPWTYDGSWALNRFIREVQTIGGFYNQAFSSIDSGTYHKITGVTLAVNRPGLLNTRSGFVTG